MTLFFYVLRDFIKYVLGTVVLCTFLFIMFDFIHKTTKYFAEFKPSTRHIAQFYFYQMPSMLSQALPIASLLASVISMVLLSRTNEITAMRAAGMGPFRIGLPIAIGGIFLSVSSLVLGEFVVPMSSEKMHYIKDVLIEQESDAKASEGAQWLRDENRLINYKDYDSVANTLTGIRVIETGTNFRPKETMEAKHAKYQPETKDWLLSDIKVLYFRPNGTLAFSETKDNLSLKIPIEPKKLKRERRTPNELSLKELYDLVDRGQYTGIDISRYEVDMHIKFAFHFASFVVCLIGLKFGFRSERTMETARSVLLAIAIGISYWFILNAGKALGTRGVIPVILGAWSANIIIFFAACIMIWRTRRLS